MKWSFLVKIGLFCLCAAIFYYVVLNYDYNGGHPHLEWNAIFFGLCILFAIVVWGLPLLIRFLRENKD